MKKIQKLLRLARDKGASPAEAAAAIRKAVELAEREGIDLNDVSLDETDTVSGLTHSTAFVVAYGEAERSAAAIACLYFGVTKILDRRGKKVGVHFIGNPTDTRLAEYVFSFLARSMRGAWKAADKRYNRTDFMNGFADAVWLSLPKNFQRLQGEELVESARGYIERVILDPDTRITTRRLRNSRQFVHNQGRRAGERAGQAADVHNAVDTDANKLAG